MSYGFARAPIFKCLDFDLPQYPNCLSMDFLFFRLAALHITQALSEFLAGESFFLGSFPG